jgi:hypothetical protein
MNEVICPDCKKPIYDEDALTCHFCGNSLRRASGGVFGAMRGPGMKWVFAAVGVLMLTAFIMTMM